MKKQPSHTDFSKFLEANEEALERQRELLENDIHYQRLIKKADEIWKEITTPKTKS